MKAIRYNTFETNSSSTHSLAVPKTVGHIPSDIRFHFGDFGWALESGIDPADYLYTAIVTGESKIRNKYLPMLKDVMKKHNIKATYANYELSESHWRGETDYYVSSDYGYIDHGSDLESFIEWLFEDEDRVLRFISEGLVFTGNDNDEESAAFIGRNESEIYNWETGKKEPNPYYMKNCENYDWFYKGN